MGMSSRTAIAAACCFALGISGAPNVEAQEYVQPVEIQQRLSKRLCEEEAMRVAATEGLYALATQSGARDSDARRLLDVWQNYQSRPPTVVRGSVDTSGDTCRATVRVSLNSAKVRSDLARNYVCDRPVGIVVRMMEPNASELKKQLDIEALDQAFTAELSDRGLAAIDLTELDDTLRDLQTGNTTCVVNGQTETDCIEKLSFAGAVLNALYQIDQGLIRAQDDNFNSEKLLPLLDGGVLLVVSLDVAEERRKVTARAYTNAFQISDRDATWVVNPREAPMAVRQASQADIALTLFDNIFENLAVDIAKECAAW